MAKGKVFIIQEPMQFDRAGAFVKKRINLEAAHEYGELVIVFENPHSVLDRRIVMDKAHQAAEIYNEETDYVVPVGSPTLIAAMAWAIGLSGRKLRMLEWDRGLGKYNPTLCETLATIT